MPDLQRTGSAMAMLANGREEKVVGRVIRSFAEHDLARPMHTHAAELDIANRMMV